MTADDGTSFDHSAPPVPAARALTNFTATKVGENEMVLLDNERLTYHTLNQPAFAVWQLCDGVRSVRSIQRDLAPTTVLPTEAIDLAVAELADAGLLEAEAPAKDVLINRRRVLKLAAAGGLGAPLVPVVASVTAPMSASAASQEPGATCGISDTCIDGSGNGNDYCCCGSPGSSTGVCTKKNQCRTPTICLHE